MYELGFRSLIDLASSDICNSPGVQTTQSLSYPSHRLLEYTPYLSGASLSCCATDTVAAAAGSGVSQCGDRMLYLGTYFGMVEFHTTPRSLAADSQLSAPPYTWRSSIPRFGTTLESLLSTLRLGTGADPFQAFADLLIESVDLPTGATIRANTEAIGADAGSSISLILPPIFTGREIAIAIADVASKTVPLEDVKGRTFVAGGAAILDSLVDYIARKRDTTLRRAEGAWTARGAAILASASSQRDDLVPPITLFPRDGITATATAAVSQV
jgi:sugar (pentulose or hexulose) kinase